MVRVTDPNSPVDGGGGLVRNGHVLWRKVPEGVLLLGPVAEDPLLLPGPGAAMWELLITPMKEEDIVRLLAGAYDTSAEVVGPDVSALVRDLVDRRLLVRQP